MPNYDFLNLSPFDFEELTRDLLQKHYNIYFESFTTGKDKGIDLRYSKGKKKNIIIQCKRYQDYNALKSILRKEFEKVKVLKPQRYILSTTVGLTPANKDEIKEIFDGYIKETSDIFGRGDLNNLLGQFPKVEDKNFKLWLSSTNILQKIINNAIINRSEFEEEKIHNEINIYVQNDSFNDAVDILNKYNYVIVSGIPGIGKTTLARVLIYNYLSKDFELVAVSSDIDEAEKLYEKGQKQVFYYDDFLGRNFLEDRLTKNEDQRLIRFIEKIKKNPNKKLIMTTREYILKQAQRKYEIFASSNIELAKCIVDLEKYTRLIKAKILYNHLYYSKLPESFIKAILADCNYLKIINHKNYNPRIIQIMTDCSIESHTSDKEFFSFFVNNLDNPTNIWDHSFTSQISTASQYLLYTLFISGDPIYDRYLENAFWEIYSNDSKKLNFNVKREDYHNSLIELENTFIKIIKNKTDGSIEGIKTGSLINLIQFQNPSIKDFLLNKIKNNKKLICSLLENSIYFDQLFNVFTTNPENKNDKIFLESDIIPKLANIIIQKFDNLKSIRLNINFGLSNSKLSGGFECFYGMRNLSNIHRLYEIASFFDTGKSFEIKDFLLGRVMEFENFERLNSQDISYFVKLLIILRKYCEFESSNFVKVLLSSIETVDDLYELSKIKKNSEKSFELLFNNYEKQFLGIVNDIIESEVESASDLDEIDYTEKLKSDLVEIGEILKIDLSSVILNLERIIENQYENLPPEEDLEHYSSSSYSGGNEEEIIKNMFGSLNQS